VDGDGAWFLSNRPGPVRHRLESGIYGLSNGSLDEPWPKTDRIKAMLEDWMQSGDDSDDALFDRVRADDAPQVEPGQAHRSPVFIRNPVYGTRCTTLVAVDALGAGRIVERRYDAGGDATGQTAITFDWPSSIFPEVAK
jgi:uncharacterized protein with NRDE domain